MLKENVLCISGMHRSGTSLTASWLEICGLRLHDGKFHGPAVGNEKGHFEDVDFVDLHAEAIRTKKPDSAGWRIFDADEIVFTFDQVALARRLVQERNRKSHRWGWKDPRTVFFLNQWKSIIPAMKTLLVWRPYRAVTNSLIRRSNLARPEVFKVSPEEAARLWMAYNERVCAYKNEFPEETLLLALDSLLENDHAIHGLIVQKLGIPIDYKPISQVFESNLLETSRSAPRSGDNGMPAEARILQQRLVTLSDCQFRG